MVLTLGITGFLDLLIVQYFKKYGTQRFRNWISVRPQLRGKRHSVGFFGTFNPAPSKGPNKVTPSLQQRADVAYFLVIQNSGRRTKSRNRVALNVSLNAKPELLCLVISSTSYALGTDIILSDIMNTIIIPSVSFVSTRFITTA
jgi:hypothetical protein